MTVGEEEPCGSLQVHLKKDWRSNTDQQRMNTVDQIRSLDAPAVCCGPLLNRQQRQKYQNLETFESVRGDGH